MTFLDLAKARYSVRKYTQQPVEDEKLAAILEAGKAAPTAVNYQPQRIYVLKSPEARARMATVCRYTFNAPVLLLVCYDKSRCSKNPLMPGYTSGEADATIVCTHMMLAAWEQGLGSCWVGYFNADEISRTFGLPENVRPIALLPIGYAAADSHPAADHFECRPDAEMIEFL